MIKVTIIGHCHCDELSRSNVRKQVALAEIIIEIGRVQKIKARLTRTRATGLK